MSPEQLRIQELERQVKQLTDFMLSFENKGQLAPNVINTIRQIVGAVRLSSLQDVTGTDSASNGQVLKYNGINWAPGTDNTGA